LRIVDLLSSRAEKGAAVIATLHDLTLAARGCDRLAVMSGGRIVALATPVEALSGPVLAEAFGLEGGLVDTPAGWVMAARRAGSS
jgi:iron complex transport system ATP-binding protein